MDGTFGLNGQRQTRVERAGGMYGNVSTVYVQNNLGENGLKSLIRNGIYILKF